MHLKDIKFTPLLDTLRLQKISDEEYFSVKYADYISNSRLRNINPKQNGTIQEFLDGLQAHRLFIPSLPLGSAVHEMVLQPEYFTLVDSITTKPTAKAGFIAEEVLQYLNGSDSPTKEMILKACGVVDYYSGHPNDNQYNKLKAQVLPFISDVVKYTKESKEEKTPIFLDSKQLETAKSCIEALQKNKKVQQLLHPEGLIEPVISENEQAILLDVEVDLPDLEPIVVRLKSKLDNYTIDKDSNCITVNDIKTHGNTVDKFDEAVLHFHYYREMAMYSYLLKLCATKFYNMQSPDVKSNFLVVSTVPKYYTKVVPMTSELFNKGFKEFKYLLKLAAVALYFKDEQEALKYLNDCK